MRTTPGLLTGRIVGIDLARLAAIVGMMAAHLYAIFASDEGLLADRLIAHFVDATISSTAATTFAVLGGVSLVLLSRSMRDVPPCRMLLSTTIRGALISLIGFCLEQLHGPISVVLTAYGVALMLAAPALLLRSWIIAVVTGTLWLFGAALNAQVRASSAIATGADPGEAIIGALRDLIITGHYPAITWIAYMLVGTLIARALLGAASLDALRDRCLRLALTGFAIYACITVGGRLAAMNLAWFGLPPFGDEALSSGGGAPLGTELWMLLIPTPHSGNPADMLRTVAGACFLIGMLVLLADAPRRTRNAAATPGVSIMDGLRAAGAAPLTIYTAHVIVTAGLTAQSRALEAAGDAVPFWFANGSPIFIAQLVCVIAVGAVLAAMQMRGPLEALLARLSGVRAGSPGSTPDHA